jgi:hypothetical protein
MPKRLKDCNTFSFCIIPRGEKIVTQNVGKRRKIAEKAQKPPHTKVYGGSLF